jgi:CRP-like cAMP-binding protein
LNNHILSRLARASELAQFLKPLRLAHGAILYEPDQEIRLVYFPTTALVSLVVPLENGSAVETAMVGADGIVGGASAINGEFSSNRAIVQIPGDALSIDAATLRRLARGSIEMHSLIAAHEKVVMAQSQQSAACNAMHTLDERLAKWLLLARDRVGRDDLALTQEFIAEMVGVRRTSVTVEAGRFQEAGLIRYRRGQIDILQVDGLKDAACECYAAISKRFDQMLNPTQNRPAQ